MNSRQQHLVRLAVLIGLILFGMSGYVWWTKIYTNPERIFWSAAANNLATTGVTRSIKDEGNTSTAAPQITQLQLGGNNIAITDKAINDGGGNEVSTQTVMTPQQTYTRITGIKTSDKSITEQKLALVVNVWAKSEVAAGQISQPFVVAASGALPSLPVANLSPQQRSEILSDMKTNKVYTVDFAAAKTETHNGRQVRVYDITINVEPFVTVLKKLGTMTGTKEYQNVEPRKYQGQTITGMRFAVDSKSRQLAYVYDSNNKFRETYSSYGVAVNFALPTQTVPESELQSRFTQLGASSAQ